jgi:monoamine oxidase
VIRHPFDVVIVGGGAAGIGAARRLAGTGLTTLLVEADSRLGGRAWTREIAGRSLDLGCGWLHSADKNSWAVIAEQAGMKLEKRRAAWGVQYGDLGFTRAEQAEARKVFEGWMQKLAAVRAASDRAADALQPGGPWNAYVQAIVNFISGGPLQRMSAADYLNYDEASTDSNWRAVSGLGALVAGSLPDGVALRLALPVESLALVAQGVRLGTAVGDIAARCAILTVSTAVLAGDTIKLPRELDPWREAARNLPLGYNEKLFLEIRGTSPFEVETQVLGNPRDARTASYYLQPLGMPVVECFFGGDSARLVSDEGPGAGFAHALDQLDALFGASVRGHLRPLAASSWGRTTRIGGAYSYALPGQADARQSLARPFDGRVFFAGEATSRDEFSTAHGAHDSGVRAASEAIEALVPGKFAAVQRPR